MSGHSKWSTIKHKKALKDAKKGKVFSKLAQKITMAAREGGGDANMNFTLRLYLDKAKAANMPAVNIERAVNKGAGKGEKIALESAIYEGFGPDNVAVMVEVLTENKNRAVTEIRQIFHERGGTFAEPGAVSWNFTHRGVVTVKPGKMVESEKYGKDPEIKLEPIDDVMMALMEVPDVMDIKVDHDDEDNQYLSIYCEPNNLGKVRDAVKLTGYVIDGSELIYLPKTVKNESEVDLEKVSDFVEAIEEYEDVVNVFTDLV